MSTTALILITGLGGPILGALVAGLLTYYVPRWRSKKAAEGSTLIEMETRQKVGSLRSHQVTMIQVDRSTVILPEAAGQSTWIKKGESLASLLTARRQTEVAAVEFPIIRHALEVDLSNYSWLDRDFKTALQLVLSSAASEAPIDLAEAQPQEAQFLRPLAEMERHLRVTHLLLPEIRRLHQADLTEEEKRHELETYFLNLADGRALFYVGSQPDDVHCNALEHVLRKNLVVPKILEARGRHTNKAIRVATTFVERNPNWAIKRVDIAAREMGEEAYLKAQLWIELVTADPALLASVRDRRLRFIQALSSIPGCDINEFRPLDKNARTDVYRQLRQGMSDGDGSKLSAQGEGVSSAVFLAAAFIYMNPHIDYHCVVHHNPAGEPILTIFFSLTPLAGLYEEVSVAGRA